MPAKSRSSGKNGKTRRITRRQFLKTAAGTAAAVALAPKIPLWAQASGEVPVAIGGIPSGSSEAEIEKAFRDVISKVDDFSWLKPGQSVLLKVAANSPFPYPWTTHPLAVKTMVKILKDKGAGKIVVGDQSGSLYTFEAGNFIFGSLWKGLPIRFPFTYRTSVQNMELNGIAKAAREAGAEVIGFEEGEHHWKNPDGAKYWKGLGSASTTDGYRVTEWIDKADHIVSLPRVSPHLLAGHTNALKNNIGYIKSEDRMRYHFSPNSLSGHFLDMIAEMNLAVKDKTRLIVSLGLGEVGTTGGPDGGAKVKLEQDFVYVTKDAVAADAVGLGLLKIHRARTSWWDRFLSYFYAFDWMPFLRNPFYDPAGRDDLSAGSVWTYPMIRHAIEAGAGASPEQVRLLDVGLNTGDFEKLSFLVAPHKGLVQILEDAMGKGHEAPSGEFSW